MSVGDSDDDDHGFGDDDVGKDHNKSNFIVLGAILGMTPRPTVSHSYDCLKIHRLETNAEGFRLYT